MEKISVFISEEEIDKRVRELGEIISRDYEGKQIHVIGILKGGAFFACELSKRVTVPVVIDFMSVSSYGDSTTTSGEVKIIKDLDGPIEGEDVLIIEDIIDTGITMSHLIKRLAARNPKSIKLCALLNKEERRRTEVKIDYLGFDVPDKFVVGYGLDYAQKYRNLPYIGLVEFEE